MNKKLYRSNKDKMIGGVAAGLGDYFDIDHTLVRVLFVVTLFLGGTGVVAYIIMWIIVPEEPIIFKTQETKSENEKQAGGEGEQKQFEANAYYSALDSQREKRRIFAGAILVILGLMFLADNFIPRIRFGDFWPLILIGIGIGLLLNAKRNNSSRKI